MPSSATRTPTTTTTTAPTGRPKRPRDRGAVQLGMRLCWAEACRRPALAVPHQAENPKHSQDRHLRVSG